MAKSAVWFGDSGTYKTTNLYFAAKYLFAKYKKPIRMITAEQWQPIESLVNAGIVDLIEFSSDTCKGNPLPALVKLSRGWWPVQTSRGKVLVAPSFPGEKTENELDKVCAYFVEGLSSISDVLMTDEKNKGRAHSEQIIAPFVEDGIKFGQISRSHYLFTQATVLERLVEFGNLPVERVIFTAHEAKGEDDDRQPIRGPGLAGKAGTAKVARKVGASIHFERYYTTKAGQAGSDKVDTLDAKVRAFFIAHPDKMNPAISYDCKPRVNVKKIPQLMERFPGGYIELTLNGGMEKMLQAEDELEMGNLEEDLKWKEQVLSS